MSAKRHPHDFTLLYYHFGSYGPQDVHVHPCFDEDCDRVLIGAGRECDGSDVSHHRETLTDNDVLTRPVAAAERTAET